MFDPPLQVVVPPRPCAPATLARRLMDVLESGQYKCGNRWTTELTELLTERLRLGPDHELWPTVSGTAALRLGIRMLCGPRTERKMTAVLPSFTFAATGEVLRQLGLDLIFCDVDAATWTLCPSALQRVLERHAVDLVVAVDALGVPADYTALTRLCQDAGVALLADSASALGAWHRSDPVGTQAAAHAFSMSMAKIVSSAGAGGFAVLPASSRLILERDENWVRSSLMTETNAVVALDQLYHLDEILAKRATIAGVYRTAVDAVPGLTPQATSPGDTHGLTHWVLRCGPPHDRDAIARRLKRLGVLTKPYYAPALHEFLPQSATSDPLPVTRALAAEVLALPMSSEMSGADAVRVTQALALAVGDQLDRED